MSTNAIQAVTSSGQPVLILKEGSNTSRGKEAQRNNIQAAKLVAEIVKSSIGPRGMDKMLVDSLGDVTITNDGATSAVILAGALLEKAETLIDKGVHPTIIVEGYTKAAAQAIKILNEIAEK